MKIHVMILKKCIALTSPTILCVLKKFVFANKQQIEAISVCWRVKQKFKGTFRAFFLFFSVESKLPEDRLQRSQSFHKLSRFDSTEISLRKRFPIYTIPCQEKLRVRSCKKRTRKPWIRYTFLVFLLTLSFFQRGDKTLFLRGKRALTLLSGVKVLCALDHIFKCYFEPYK